MGMYTKLQCNLKLKEDIPQEILETINALNNSEELPIKLEHEFFNSPGLSYMFNMCSHYFTGTTNTQLRFNGYQYIWHIDCDLKNYNNEIELFLDWISPYVEAEENEFVGYSMYEENKDSPNLIFYKKGKLEFKEKRMKAKDQFKKLGYKFSYNQDKTVMQYEKKKRQWREEGQININFDLEERTIDTIFRGKISNNLPPILIPEEIEAMNNQCKELGWL